MDTTELHTLIGIVTGLDSARHLDRFIDAEGIKFEDGDGVKPRLREEMIGWAEWRLWQILPHIRWTEASEGMSDEERTVDAYVDAALKLEAERADRPPLPLITHEDLVRYVDFVQRRWRDLGTPQLKITTPWEWQWPAARVFEMLYRTHCDVPAEEFVEELYRREPRARIETGG